MLVKNEHPNTVPHALSLLQWGQGDGGKGSCVVEVRVLHECVVWVRRVGAFREYKSEGVERGRASRNVAMYAVD